MFDNKDVGNFGLTETMNSLLWNMTEVPAPHTWWFHFRVVSTQQEQSDQYHGDFQGYHLVFENYDPTFIKTHRLPDGNLYKLKDGIFDGSLLKRHKVHARSLMIPIFRIFAATSGPSALMNGSITTLIMTKPIATIPSMRRFVTLMFSHETLIPKIVHGSSRLIPKTILGGSGLCLGILMRVGGPNWGSGIDYSHNAAIIANGGNPILSVITGTLSVSSETYSGRKR